MWDEKPNFLKESHWKLDVVRLAAPQMIQENMLNKVFCRAKWHLKCSQDLVSWSLLNAKNVLSVGTTFKQLQTNESMELFYCVKIEVCLCFLYSIENKFIEPCFILVINIISACNVVILVKVFISCHKPGRFLERESKYTSRTNSHITYSCFLQSEPLNKLCLNTGLQD